MVWAEQGGTQTLLEFFGFLVQFDYIPHINAECVCVCVKGPRAWARVSSPAAPALS